MNFFFLSLICIIFSLVSCSNFRVIAENKEENQDVTIPEESETVPLISLTAKETTTTTESTPFQKTQFTRQMDDLVLEHEKPVLLNTIPHTMLNHVLFINSSGLFTNVTVVLTTTIPIATVNSDNDSIHRILSNTESNKVWDEVKNGVSKIAEEMLVNNASSEEMLNITQRNAESIRKISSIFLSSSNYNNSNLGIYNETQRQDTE